MKLTTLIKNSLNKVDEVAGNAIIQASITAISTKNRFNAHEEQKLEQLHKDLNTFFTKSKIGDKITLTKRYRYVQALLEQSGITVKPQLAWTGTSNSKILIDDKIYVLMESGSFGNSRIKRKS